MKLAQLLVQSSGPFRDFQIDLTYPEGHPRAGQAMDRVCFIGPNGIGKSSLTRIITDYLRNPIRFQTKNLLLAKLQLKDRSIYSAHINKNGLLFRTDIDQQPMWMFELIRDGAFTMAFNRNYEQYCIGHEEEPELYEELWFDNNGADLLVHQPADYQRDRTIGLTDVPPTKPHEAESLAETFPYYNEISPDKTTEFWALLIFLIHKRERAFREFSERQENRGKPEALLTLLYRQAYPEVLPGLAQVWQPILDHVGIVVDLEQATLPTSLRDKLVLHLKLRNGGQRVEYGDLGTGLRRLLFNIGHTWALHFHREIANGFCVLEEPEVGLFPSLVQVLIPQYQNLIGDSQLFVSTHHPLIAAAFAPAERLILGRDAKGAITVRRSNCNPGAGVEEILASDFA